MVEAPKTHPVGRNYMEPQTARYPAENENLGKRQASEELDWKSELDFTCRFKPRDKDNKY